MRWEGDNTHAAKICYQTIGAAVALNFGLVSDLPRPEQRWNPTEMEAGGTASNKEIAVAEV